MKPNEITRARTALETAGSPADREAARLSLLDRVRNDTEILLERLRAVREECRQFLAARLSIEVPADVPVIAIQEDVHKRRVYIVSGFVTVAAEAVLSAWVFASRLLLNPLIGVIIALAITVVVKGRGLAT